MRYTAILAAAAVIGMTSGAFADSSPVYCSGEKTGWTKEGGEAVTTTICYDGASGNVVPDCAGKGNWVVVTVTSETDAVWTNPAGNQSCIMEGSSTCDISRAKDVGSTDFDYCDAE